MADRYAELNARLTQLLREKLAEEPLPPSTPPSPEIMQMLQVGGEAPLAEVGVPGLGAAASVMFDPDVTKIPGIVEAERRGEVRLGEVGPEVSNLTGMRSLTGGAQPTYFSTLRRVFEDTRLPNRLNADEVRKMLVKRPGVTREEMKWSGLDDFLEEKRGQKVTKDEVLKHLDANEIQVEEINFPREYNEEEFQKWKAANFERDATGHYTRNGVRIFNDSEQAFRNDFLDENTEPLWGPTSHPDLSLPGAQNYREVLLRWGNKPPTMEPVGYVRLPDGTVNSVYGSPEYVEQYANRFNGQIIKQTQVPVLEESSRSTDFRTLHYEGQKNILAHLRLTDRTTPDGKKVLFIEEMQSDWHQRLSRRQDSVHSAANNLVKQGVPEVDALAQAEAMIPKVPDAPIKNWEELVMKRVMRMASEQDYDAVGWTTAQQQLERYPGSKAEKLYQKVYEVNAPSAARKFGKKFGMEPTRGKIRVYDDGLPDEPVGPFKGAFEEVHLLPITPAARASREPFPLFQTAGATTAGALTEMARRRYEEFRKRRETGLAR